MTSPEIIALEQRYRDLTEQLGTLGFAVPGTVLQRFTHCASATCHCHNDPPQLHGPYWQYTRKLAGKTLTRRITAEQADTYRKWIANRRLLDEILDQMDTLSRQASDLTTAKLKAKTPAS